MKKILIVICVIMEFASTVYAASFFCGNGKTKEQCCAEHGRVYCPNENECRTRCPNVTEPDCIGGCINPEGKCCVSCPRTCPDGEYLINADSCYECGKIGCPDGEVMMADGSCQGCVDGYHAYCNVLSDSGLETAEAKSCIGVGCTASTSCVLTQNGNVQECCSSGQTAYIQTTYEDGTPKDITCCSSGYEVQSLGTPDGGYGTFLLTFLFCYDT